MTAAWRKLVAEGFGTFALVIAGTGAIVINDVSGGTVSHVGIGLTFGLIVMVMIYAIGDVSGCHLNPAVTLGFVAARRFDWQMIIPYIASQIAGAFVGSILLRWMFPKHEKLGATLPGGDLLQSFVLEFVLAMLLMFVILSVTTGAKEKGGLVGIIVGAVIALEAIFAGPITGASMNPARSLAPAVVSGHLEHLWIYLTAPVTGALAGSLMCAVIHGPECRVKATRGTQNDR